MRSLCVTPAIVLRSWPFGESDKIVSLLTEQYGRVVGIAKGAKRSRKRFANSLEPFSLVNLQFQDRPHTQLAFIVASDLIPIFKSLPQSLEKIAYASYLVEITEGLTGEREENHSIFHHLREGLSFLDDNGTSLAFLTFFELKLLRLSGYQPMLDRCHRCGGNWQARPLDSWRFSIQEGGILCGSCSSFREEVVSLSYEALDALTRLQKAGETFPPCLSISSSILSEVREIMFSFIQFQSHREIKSASFVSKFAAE